LRGDFGLIVEVCDDVVWVDLLDDDLVLYLWVRGLFLGWSWAVLLLFALFLGADGRMID
jgi:hypothetical protein